MDRREGAKLLKGSGEKKALRGARLKLLFSVVNAGDEGKLKEIVDDCSIALSFAFAGTGTAHSAVLDYLGIGQSEKSVLLSLFPETDEEIVLREIRQKMALYRVGRGISFTVPLSGASEIISNGLLRASEKSLDGRKLMKDEERKYDLIVAAIAVNHVDLAMEAARSAGAAGGTILRARSIENAKAEQFIGINLLEGQEILLILARRENKLAIMNALNETVGLKTEAGGVIFSLPVDRTAGITAQDEEDEKREERGE